MKIALIFAIILAVVIVFSNTAHADSELSTPNPEVVVRDIVILHPVSPKVGDESIYWIAGILAAVPLMAITRRVNNELYKKV